MRRSGGFLLNARINGSVFGDWIMAKILEDRRLAMPARDRDV
jgi:hypothetical protein